MMTFSQMQAIIAEILETQRQSGLRQEEFNRQQEQLSQRQEQFNQQQEKLSQRQEQFSEKMEQEMNLFLARQRELQEGDLRLQSKLDQLSQQHEQLSQHHEQLSQRQEQFHEKIQQEINMFLATQRELQESDLRRQSELDKASQQIQGLMRIAESLVTNAQITDRITEDHEQRIRRLEQE